MPLSPEQEFVFSKYKDGKNIFITGPGGTGKTKLIQIIAHHAQELNDANEDVQIEEIQKIKKIEDDENIKTENIKTENIETKNVETENIETKNIKKIEKIEKVKKIKINKKNFQVCALTGCAAVLLECEANTLHSWAGIGLARGTVNEVIERVVKSKFRRKNWNKIKLLIVDEVSMLSLKLLIILNTIAQIIKKSSKPFGGIQIIFAGDFHQLPPIGDDDDPTTSAFCFESNIWKDLFDEQIELKTIFRQTDKKYTKILNEIRVGRLHKSSYNLLQKYIREPNPEDKIKPPILLSRRKDVDKINLNEMSKLVEPTYIYKYEEIREIEENKNLINKFSEEDMEHELQYLKNNILALDEIKLRIGTQVMCIANIDIEGTNAIINGSQGIICEFKNGFPIVEFRSGERRIIKKYLWKSEIIPGIGIQQIPLIQAWAITIHKAQGLTLETAQIDVGNAIFECGQTYVALSRIISLDGLYLIAFNPYKIKFYKKVEEFYKNF